MDFLTRGINRRALLAVGAAILISESAAAQVFSPGEMSEAHKSLSSISDCTRCHSGEARIDRRKCLSCHKAIQTRIAQKKGWHGRPEVRTAPCEQCHQEHLGKDASLIPWPSGNINAFDHKKTGWPLRDAHRKVPCDSCHNADYVRDPKIRKKLKEKPKLQTKLGLSTQCADCHFDEHRGALGADCSRCHDETKFKFAPKFHHDKVWPLRGAHRKVACDSCHKPKRDPHFAPSAFPKPRAAEFLQMTPVAHERCADCHEDPHRNRFGDDCLKCHTEETWNLDAPPKDPAFHDKTDFPLTGRHRFVPCARCHPKRKGKTRLTPVAHDRCERCHPNAHPDFTAHDLAARDCSDCHDTKGFRPSKFTVKRHEQTRFPLKDAHTAVPCPVCHLQKLGHPGAVKPASQQKSYLASLVQSPWRMRADISPNECVRCHESPHREQFKDTPCTDCHTGRTWRIAPDDFSHDTKTQFPLKGKHRAVSCPACHPTETDAEGTFVRYRPVDHADCNSCHLDVHYGQLTLATPKAACRDCHDESGFIPARFDHNDRKQCTFPLRGKHRKVPCERCHPTVLLTPQISTTRYRPTMKACEGCHEDAHHGAYLNAEKRLRGTSRIRTRTAPLVSAEALPWIVPQSWYGAPSDRRTNCALCHTENDWHTVSFDHGNTGFPLRGRHKKVACDQCHEDEKKAAQGALEGCRACHRDPHRGRLGEECADCHTEEGFDRTEKARARHNRTGFPLTGRHAALPCTECHQDVRDLGFGRTPTDCVACHKQDIPGPGESQMDHSALSRDCGGCHTPVSFQTAAYKGHDRCFPIGTISRHGSVACEKCHQGALPTPGENCSGSGFSCTQCHTCLRDRHRKVQGYECSERRCYECHRNP